MDYCKDELEPPKWMDREFLTKVINSNELSRSIELHSYTIEPAVAKGNHFGSAMFRTNVKYSTDNNKEIKEDSFIIKTIPEEDGYKKDLLNKSNVFETETHMYTQTIPKLEKEFKNHGIDVVFGPRIIYHSNEPTMLVLQDLNKLGFSMPNNALLNFENYKLTLNKLIKWHASSYKINAENKSELQFYGHRHYMSQNNPEVENFFQNAISSFTYLLKETPELKDYVEIYEDVRHTLFKEIKKSHSHLNSKINVLNHGDFHAKNLLFKYNDSKEIEDMLFVDFQCCSLGSPAIDLIYSMYMMLDPETRFSRRDEIIHYYYTSFVNTLKSLNFNGEIPTFEDLQIEMIKMKKWEIFLFVVFLPNIYQITSGVKLDFEDFVEDNSRKIFIKNQKFIEDVKRSFPWFLHQGYFH